MLPPDLRHFTSSFSILTSEQAGTVIGLIVAGLVLADVVAAAWRAMFS